MGALDHRVPEISRFLGIIIRMRFGDHAPPHLHATYGGVEASFEIPSGAPLGGVLPPRQARLVSRWITLHPGELLANWERARRHASLQPVPPLS